MLEGAKKLQGIVPTTGVTQKPRKGHELRNKVFYILTTQTQNTHEII